MSKKTIAVIAELIPVVSAVVSFVLLAVSYDSELIRQVIQITMILAFLGFVFPFVGRKVANGDRTVRVIGLFDWAATLSVVVLYVLAIFSFGL